MDKEKKTNIYETNNYNKSLTVNDANILNSFCQLVNEYLFHITENIIIQNREYYIFIVLRGLHTLKHIFNVLLLYTKNLELTIYHAKIHKFVFFDANCIGRI